MKGDPQRVKKASEAMGETMGAMGDMGAQISEKMQEMTKSGLQQGQIPKDLLGINEAMMEGIYGQAYRLYNTGKYRDACQLFRLLIMLNASESKYTMGLAACFHMLKEFRNAVGTYSICGMLDPENPIPHFHASDCYIQMGDMMAALIALEMAVKRSGNKQEYATLKDRALLTMESLRKEIAEGEGLKKRNATT